MHLPHKLFRALEAVGLTKKTPKWQLVVNPKQTMVQLCWDTVEDVDSPPSYKPPPRMCARKPSAEDEDLPPHTQVDEVKKSERRDRTSYPLPVTEVKEPLPQDVSAPIRRTKRKSQSSRRRDKERLRCFLREGNHSGSDLDSPVNVATSDMDSPVNSAANSVVMSQSVDELDNAVDCTSSAVEEDALSEVSVGSSTLSYECETEVNQVPVVKADDHQFSDEGSESDEDVADDVPVLDPGPRLLRCSETRESFGEWKEEVVQYLSEDHYFRTLLSGSCQWSVSSIGVKELVIDGESVSDNLQLMAVRALISQFERFTKQVIPGLKITKTCNCADDIWNLIEDYFIFTESLGT